MRKRVCWLLLACVMGLVLCVSAFAETREGTIGTAKFTLTDAGVLTITGGSFTLRQWDEAVDVDIQVKNLEITSVKFDSTVLNDEKARFMFDGWFDLKEVDLSGLNTSSVTDMSYMFDSCLSLVAVKFGGAFDTSKVTSMESMFQYCSALKTVDLNGIDTSSVENMATMFWGCQELESIAWGASFDVSGVFDMAYMFADCSSLTELDLSSWNTKNVEFISSMFQNCKNLVTINVGEGWNVERVKSGLQMFEYATSLVGGEGTRYDPENVDEDYAHPDGGKDNPGYLTVIKRKPKVSAPTGLTLTYNIKDQKLITAGSTDGGTIKYSLEEKGTYSTEIPTGKNAKEYPVWYKVEGGTYYEDYGPEKVTAKIEKANPLVTAPTGKTLSYTGATQTLVNAGTAVEDMTLLYSLDGTTYSEDIPAAIEAKTYTVSYKIDGGVNYKDVSGTVTAKIVDESQPSGDDNGTQLQPVEITPQKKEQVRSILKENIESMDLPSGVDPSTVDVFTVTEDTVKMGEKRNTSSLKESEKAAVSDDNKVPAAVLPEMSFDVTGVYCFETSLDVSAPEGATLEWHSFPQTKADDGSAASISARLAADGAGDKTAVFMKNGKTITTVPTDHKVEVAAYFEKGITYAPVIAAVKSNTTDGPTSDKGSGGGCNSGLGAVGLLICLAFLVKRR